MSTSLRQIIVNLLDVLKEIQINNHEQEEIKIGSEVISLQETINFLEFFDEFESSLLSYENDSSIDLMTKIIKYLTVGTLYLENIKNIVILPDYEAIRI